MKEDVLLIKERNQRVEADKAWETSRARKTIVAVITYFIVFIFLEFINAPNPWLNALIPPVGFILSTLTLTFFKRLWLNNWYRK